MRYLLIYILILPLISCDAKNAPQQKAIPNTFELGGWVAITEGGVGGTIYMDPSTKVKKDSVVRIWTLVDYKNPQEGYVYNPSSDKSINTTYFSTTVLTEFNCAEKSWRNREGSFHSKNMAQGHEFNSFHSADSAQFEPVRPTSIAQIELNYVCAMP
ncbi:MAG TPA: surface-adhesin E family protein [Novimethylophilus sp.]|jgi:hypothetical protein|uniref:surface-adhesin E family protein n=1 Tax=Novimethylophilus sp. TaxID=2137426 RepID=UPI002F412073